MLAFADMLYITAIQSENRNTPTKIDEEMDEWESVDELVSDSWDYVSILYDGMESEMVDQAFQRLSYR